MASTPTQHTTPTTVTTPSHPAYTLLTRAHTPSTASQIFTSKIKNKPLLLTTTTTTDNNTNNDNRALRRKIRAHKHRYQIQHARPRPLSAKEKRTLKIYDLPPSEIKYSIYQGLNSLWKGYILEVLGFVKDGSPVATADMGKKLVTQTSHGSLLASADFHGMEVEVVRCKDVGKVGIKGIVVRETKGSMVVVTERDEKRVVLKRGTVFRVVVDLPSTAGGGGGAEDEAEAVMTQQRRLVFELHGSQLEIRPVERAVKKFKWHAIDYL